MGWSVCGISFILLCESSVVTIVPRPNSHSFLTSLGLPQKLLDSSWDFVLSCTFSNQAICFLGKPLISLWWEIHYIYRPI
jgi:hypothetical protein